MTTWMETNPDGTTSYVLEMGPATMISYYPYRLSVETADGWRQLTHEEADEHMGSEPGTTERMYAASLTVKAGER